MDKVYYIDQKKIDLSKCEILYNRPFSKESLQEDFEQASGQWYMDTDGWLTGIHRDNSGGILYSNDNYDCDTIMEFDAKTVAPCDNDLNFVFKTCGWDYEKNDAGRGYIAGLGGWWTNKTGIEKYPSCMPRVLTPLFPLEAGKQYHIVAGSINGHCFIFVDSKLIIEMTDPSPEDFKDCGRIGFGTYASYVKYTNFTLYKAEYEQRDLSYEVKF